MFAGLGRRAGGQYNAGMTGRQCYHCKQWVADTEPHDCWTTTEAALTDDLPEDLRDAWERIREAGAALGDQRIYASHNSIMFARQSCYFFVRPKKSFLEVCVFLDRALEVPQVRRSTRTSKTRVANILQIRHRDEVEAPVTDWVREAYELSGSMAAPSTPKRPKLKPRPMGTARARRKAGAVTTAAKRR